MADKDPNVIDYGTARVYAENLLKEYKAVQHLAEILATVTDAQHWMQSTRQETAAIQAESDKAKVERVAAVKATETAKRVQSAVEEAARQAEAAATAAENQAATRIRAAQNNQGARLKELEDALEGRRRMLESDLAARRAELEEQIGKRQAVLAEVTAQIEALRNRL